MPDVTPLVQDFRREFPRAGAVYDTSEAGRTKKASLAKEREYKLERIEKLDKAITHFEATSQPFGEQWVDLRDELKRAAANYLHGPTEELGWREWLDWAEESLAEQVVEWTKRIRQLDFGDEAAVAQLFDEWVQLLSETADVNSSALAKGAERRERSYGLKHPVSWPVATFLWFSLRPKEALLAKPKPIRHALARCKYDLFQMDSRPSGAQFVQILKFARWLQDELPAHDLACNDFIDVVTFVFRASRAAKMAAEPHELVQMLEELEPQVILQGPPGTGKTYSAREILTSEFLLEKLGVEDQQRQVLRLADAQALAEDKQGEVRLVWEIVQFHPSYHYEDFVRGIVPETGAADNSGATGSLAFEARDKVFAQMCNFLVKHKDARGLLIIDEINRADLSRVFGECMYALEYRDEPIETPYAVNGRNGGASRTLCVPRNLWIVGTMNSADRSIAIVDYALRRRFQFVDVHPSFEVIEQQYDGVAELRNDLERWRELWSMVNGDTDGEVEEEAGEPPLISKPEYRLGHSYFLVARNDEEEDGSYATRVRKVVGLALQYKVKPLLEEYHREGILRGDKSKLDAWFKTNQP